MQTIRNHFFAEGVHPRGITRVELVLVLAIMSVLIALVIPGILTAREAARRKQCSNTIRTLGLAIQEFGDRKGNLPDLATLNTGTKSTDDSDLKLVLATVFAIFATACAIVVALHIKLTVRYFNRRSNQIGEEMRGEQGTDSILDSWFCPPSSSPI